MNSEIEQRIVAMYFDNKDFEKNARQTINTLGELKDNLNLEESVKGFDELDKAGKKLNLDKARSTVRSMNDVLSKMSDGMQKAFNIGSAPLHALHNFFETFQSYVTKFLGFDLASKFVGSIESALREITVAPIEAGWSMYQQNTDSIKTIMSGTIKTYKDEMSEANTDWTYNEVEHMQYVKKHVRELSQYAQKTVFSLADMTNNVGKFTNQNIDLDTSVTAMEGIANMTAKAGQGAQQASMAMYNFSQALGVGKMTSLDWRSIENANIATGELKQLFIDTAVASGQLTKVIEKDANGKELEKFFITVDKNGKKLAKSKWIEVSAENFRETLEYGWLDKETMLRVMQIYSNHVDLDTLASWGFDIFDEYGNIKDQELVDYLLGIGEEAEKAATQVRTFSKMWEAMTESVQSSWADSMELVFGDMLEATDFWTTINDKLSSVLDASAEKRNNILREWRGMTFDEKTGEWIKLDGAIDGREDLVQGIYNIIDAVHELGGAFSQARIDVFGELNGEKLKEITKGFREFTERVKEWLGSSDDSESRISKIRSGLGGLFSILKIGVAVVKTIFDIGVRIVKPFIDPLLNLFDKFGKFLKLDGAKNLGDILNTLRERLSALWSKLTNLGWDGILNKVKTWFSNLGTEIWNGIATFLDENGLSGVKEWFIQLGDKIREGYETVKTWWEGSGIPDFFKGIWDAVAGIFTAKMSSGYRNGKLESWYEDAPIVTFFKTTWDGLKSFFEDVKGWKIWTDIGSFFGSIWSKITGLFKPEVASGYKNGKLESWYEDAPIVTFFKGTWEGLKTFFEDVRSWKIWDEIGSFFSGVWNKLTGLFKPEVASGYKNGRLESWYEDSPIVKFFKGAWEGLKETFEKVKSWPIWNQIGSFFSGVWDKLTGLFKPEVAHGYKEGKLESWYEDAPIVKFFKETWEGLKSFFEEVKGWPIWNEIGSFFSNVWNKITGLFRPEIEHGYRDGKLESWYAEDPPIVKFFKDTWEKIKGVYESVKDWEIWDDIGGFFSGIIESVKSFFSGTEEVNEVVAETAGELAESGGELSSDTPKAKESVGLLERIIGAIGDFVGKIFEAIDGIVIPKEVKDIFVNIGDFLKGTAEVITSIMGSIGRVFSAIATGDGSKATGTDWAVVIVGGLLAVIGVVLDMFQTYNLSKIKETSSFSSRFMQLGIGLLAMAGAVALLTTIDQSKLLPALVAVVLLGAVIGGILAVVEKINKTSIEKQANGPKASERIATHLIDAVKTVGIVAVAMALLPNIIKAFGEAKKAAPELNGGDIMQTLLGLVAFIGGISLILGVLDKLSGSRGIDPAAAGKTAFAIIAFTAIILGGLGLIAGLLGGGAALGDETFGTEKGTTLSGALQAIRDGGEIFKAIGESINGFVRGLLGIKTDEEKAEEATKVLAGMADQLEYFTGERSAGLTRVLGLIGMLSQTVQDVPDAGKIQGFADTLEPLGTAIVKFGIAVNGFSSHDGQNGWSVGDLYENIAKTTEVFAMFNSIDGSLSRTHAEQFLAGIDYLNKEMDEEDFKAFGRIVSGIVESFNTAISTDGEAMTSMAGKLMENLSKAIKIGLSGDGADVVGAFDAMPIIDAIVVALGYGETAIATAVHNMVQAGINKSGSGEDGKGFVLDISSIAGNGFGIDLSGFNLGNMTNPMDMSQFNSFLYGEGGSMSNPAEDSLIGSLNGLSGYMEGYELPNMSDKIGNAFKFEDEEGNPLDLVGSLKETLGTFEEELNADNAFEIRIIPTFDFQNLNEEALRTALGDYPVNMAMGGITIPETMKLDVAGLAAELDMEGVKSRIGEVAAAVNQNRLETVNAIDSMSKQIIQLNNNILRLRLYLDTGALVGGIAPLIDQELGRRAALADHTGVSPTGSDIFYYLN